MIRIPRHSTVSHGLIGLAFMTAVTTSAAAQLGGPLITVSEPAFFAMSVSDLEASTAWYARVFGTETVGDVTSRDGRGRARVMVAGNLVIELIAYEGSIGADDVLPVGQHRFALRGIVKTGLFVSDAASAHSLLTANGLDVDDSVGMDERIDARTFVLRDPDDNRLQVFQRCRGAC